MKTLAVLSAALLIVLGGIYFFYWPESSDPLSEEEEGGKILELTDEQISRGDLRVYPVRKEEIKTKLPLYGKITIPQDQQTHITLRTKGIVKTAHKNIGDAVLKDEIIAVVESRELAEAKTDYLRALARLNLQKTLYENEKGLFAKKLGKEQEMHQAEAAYLEAEIEKNLSQRKLAFFGLNNFQIEQLQNEPFDASSLFEVKAPFNGTIIMRDISVGEDLPEGAAIYEIADLSNLFLNLALFPKDAEAAKIDQEVVFECGPSGRGVARLAKISPVIDEQNGMIVALAHLDNSEGCYRPGASVYADLITNKETFETCVPKEAVVTIDETPYVFVVKGNQFELREVSLGLKDDTFVHLTSGAMPGEEVVSKNAVLLKCELTKQEPD